MRTASTQVTQGARKLEARAVASNKADQYAANVLPAIREIRRAGATSLHQIADALNARGITTPRRKVVREIGEQRAGAGVIARHARPIAFFASRARAGGTEAACRGVRNDQTKNRRTAGRYACPTRNHFIIRFPGKRHDTYDRLRGLEA